jgi:hypothetical protein
MLERRRQIVQRSADYLAPKPETKVVPISKGRARW